MGISKTKGRVEEEEHSKETGQDWSTGRKSTWRTSEKAGGVQSVECYRELRQGRPGQTCIHSPWHFAVWRSLVRQARVFWLNGDCGSQISVG